MATTALPAGKLPLRPYVLSPDSTGYIIENVWPTIFYGPEVTAEVSRKVRKLRWAKQAFALMRQEAAQVMQHPPVLPMERAGWRHDFYSRTTATHLVYDPEQGTAFLDPTTGLTEYDAAQRRAWVLLTHERTYRLMRSLGVLYQVTGDECYARWVADGMRLACEYFGHAEFKATSNGGPALYFQPLYDAAMLALLANAYTLTRDSAAYTAEDHTKIRTAIFEERMPDQLDFLAKHPTHNMACYVSAALAYAGIAFERQDWVQAGLGTVSGLRTQLLNGLRADAAGKVDGLWYEGTMFYHFYSLCPLITLWQLDKQLGGNIANDPAMRARFTAMFDAPVALVDAQLRLPLVGDLGAPREMNLAGYRHLYEYAAGQLGATRYARVLAAIYAKSGAPRVDLEALAFGPDRLPAPGGIPKGATLLPVTGMGVFRTPAPASLYLTFRAGQYVGGHDHPDRLHISLNAFGALISPDLGEPGYSLRNSLHRYYRTTIAHNTLFADEQDQKGNASLVWRADATPPRARGVITDRQGISYQRTVFVDAPYVILLDEYSAPTAHRFGWAFHAYGTLQLDPIAPTAANPFPPLDLPALPTDGGYALFTDRTTQSLRDVLRATWQVTPTLRLRLLTASDGTFEATSGVAPGQPVTDTMGTLVLRAPGATRRFATVLEPYTNAPSVKNIALHDNTVTLTTTDGKTREYQWK